MTAEEFRKIRIKNKLSQTEFGELLGVQLRSIQYMEAGEVKINLWHEKNIDHLKKNNILK